MVRDISQREAIERELADKAISSDDDVDPAAGATNLGRRGRDL
jgi:hypothetical protein